MDFFTRIFDNVGKQIKIFALVTYFLGIGGSVGIGVSMLYNESPFGILVIIGGVLASWLGSMILYGFGQLIENTDKLVAKQVGNRPFTSTSFTVPQPASSTPTTITAPTTAPTKAPATSTPAPQKTPPAQSQTKPQTNKPPQDGTYANRTDLSEVHIPDSVTAIDARAFRGCKNLTSITIPNGVTSIGDYAFAYCASLKEVTIGSSVSSFGAYIFEACPKLNSIIYNGTMAEWNTISKRSDWKYMTGNFVVHCTDGDIAKADS